MLKEIRVRWNDATKRYEVTATTLANRKNDRIQFFNDTNATPEKQSTIGIQVQDDNLTNPSINPEGLWLAPGAQSKDFNIAPGAREGIHAFAVVCCDSQKFAVRGSMPIIIVDPS